MRCILSCLALHGVLLHENHSQDNIFLLTYLILRYTIDYNYMEVDMHIITQKRIWDAKKRFPTAASSLDGWYRVIKQNNFDNFSELKRTFNSIDKVGNFYVFDIGGNKIRIIATIHFNHRRIYIRAVLSHTEYDKGKWK